MKPRTDAVTGIVGREPEYGVLREFFGADPRAHALVLTGGPGIGKTTLWEAGIGIGRERGYRVLAARPSGAEAQLSFAALIDLFDGVNTGELAVPAPQRAALEVALLRAEPPGEPPPSHAIALGFLGALRALAGGERLVVAIDDVQWLDAPSADALAFAVRRLGAESIVYLLARRSGRPSSVERALESGGVSGLGALTPSERRVAELAAAGHKNREIADALYLTLATVEFHLRHCYRKLGIVSRTGLDAALEGC